MSAIGDLVRSLSSLLERWPLGASAGTALACALLAALSSVALYRFLSRICQRLSAGPLFIAAATVVVVVYLGVLGASALGGRSVEQTTLEWLTGIAEIPVRTLGPGRHAIELAALFVALQALYLFVVLLLAWALGMLGSRAVWREAAGSAGAPGRSAAAPEPATSDPAEPRADGRRKGAAGRRPGARGASRDEDTDEEDAAAHQDTQAAPVGGMARAVEEELGTRYAEFVFKLCGYHRPDAPERRFAEWGQPLGRALRWVKWLSLPGALTGALPASLWVVGAIVVDAFRRNLTPPPEAPEEAPRKKDEGARAAAALRDPNALVRALCSDPRGPQLSVVASGTLQGRPEHLAAKTRLAEESGLVRDILHELSIEGFYVHQEACTEALLAGRDVLMETPPLSGRRTLGDVLAMRTVLLEGGTVLYLSPDAEESARRAAAFRQLAHRSNWRWAIYHRDLPATGRDGMDLRLRQPQIVFATPEELHGDLCPHHADWDFFLPSLALCVAIDLERYTGPSGTNLMYVMRRLARLWERRRAKPRFLATVAPYGPDVQSFCERLLGRPLTVVGSESNSRGAPTQAVVIGVGNEAAALHPAVASRGVAIACGYPAEIWGYGDVLTAFEHEQQVNKVLLAFDKAVIATGAGGELRFDSAAALAVRLSSADAAMLPFFTRHAGRSVLGVASLSAEEVGSRAGPSDEPTLPFSGFSRPDDDEDLGGRGTRRRRRGADRRRAATDAVRGVEGDGEDRRSGADRAVGADSEGTAEGRSEPVGAPDPANGTAAAETSAALASLDLPSNMEAAIWIADDDAFARLLSRNPNWVHPATMHPMFKLGATLVATADNPLVAERHAAWAAAESPLDERERTTAFTAGGLGGGAEGPLQADSLRARAVGPAARHGGAGDSRHGMPAHDAQPPLARRERVRLAADGSLERVVELRGLGGFPPPSSTRVTTDSVARVRNRSGGEVVLETDRVRALSCAYPGRVLVRGGRRYRILMPDQQAQVADGIVWAEPERRRIQTHRIRACRLDVRGRGHEIRFGGPAAAHLHHPYVELVETVLGVRATQHARQHEDTAIYDHPVRASYPTRAAVLHLPETSDAALEALEVLVRLVLPAFVRHSEDDVDVVGLGGERPALCVVDRHPGGAGFARAANAAVLRHVLYWSQQLVAACGHSPECIRGDGCAQCVAGPPRLSPDGRVAPSRTAAAALLDELLGPVDRAA